ncbi:MAG: hypothetical protein CMJ41_08440 [Phycisphaerae bacterium]|nr:hypothetical protein [Phycisphaerae bacterium]
MLLAPTVSALGLPPRAAIDLVRNHGCRGVQLDARTSGTRPSELGESARRDLLACIRRGNQVLAGLDFWIPMQVWSDPAAQQRAMDATCSVIDLAAGLERCTVSLWLPDPKAEGELHHAVQDYAARFAVPLADHAAPLMGSEATHGIGVDPVALLADGADPVEIVSQVGARLSSARLADLDQTGQRVELGLGRLDLVGYKVAMSISPLSHLVVDLRHLSDPVSALHKACAAWDAVGPSATGW